MPIVPSWLDVGEPLLVDVPDLLSVCVLDLVWLPVGEPLAVSACDAVCEYVEVPDGLGVIVVLPV